MFDAGEMKPDHTMAIGGPNRPAARQYHLSAGDVDAGSREILAEPARHDLSAEFGLPPLDERVWHSTTRTLPMLTEATLPWLLTLEERRPATN